MRALAPTDVTPMTHSTCARLWNSGSGHSTWSSSDSPRIGTYAAATDHRQLRSVETTPLGSPVVPEV
ncbi:Uncharacterised protein [Mycobacterium tuberculosis]|nr:Uncharacterised protein [Mycobacterium tuberculosis]